MKLIINASSMVPIYEQIMDAIKNKIVSGELRPGDSLPSVRQLSSELKISALTVKKAYDRLEEEGFTAAVHGKGNYVTGTNVQMIREEQHRQIEEELASVLQKAVSYGMTKEEIQQILDLLLEDETC